MSTVLWERREPALHVYREHSKAISGSGTVVALAGVVILGFSLAGPASIGQLILGAALIVVGSLTASMYGEVRIGDTSVQIRLVPVPHRVIAIADIRKVEPVDITPLRYGGWGWRKRGRGRTALIMSGGRGACLHLADGTQFVVSGRAGRALLTELGGRRSL